MTTKRGTGITTAVTNTKSEVQKGLSSGSSPLHEGIGSGSSAAGATTGFAIQSQPGQAVPVAQVQPSAPSSAPVPSKK